MLEDLLGPGSPFVGGAHMRSRSLASSPKRSSFSPPGSHKSGNKIFWKDGIDLEQDRLTGRSRESSMSSTSAETNSEMSNYLHGSGARHHRQASMPTTLTEPQSLSTQYFGGSSVSTCSLDRSWRLGGVDTPRDSDKADTVGGPSGGTNHRRNYSLPGRLLRKSSEEMGLNFESHTPLATTNCSSERKSDRKDRKGSSNPSSPFRSLGIRVDSRFYRRSSSPMSHFTASSSSNINHERQSLSPPSGTLSKNAAAPPRLTLSKGPMSFPREIEGNDSRESSSHSKDGSTLFMAPGHFRESSSSDSPSLTGSENLSTGFQGGGVNNL